MFDLVNDVASYPEFLPWCASSEVLEENDSSMTAQLSIARSGISQSFTTKNTLDRPNSIRLSLVDGPFDALRGDWVFEQLGTDGCRVEMNLAFEINSKIAGVMLAGVFEKAADTLVEAFGVRADEVYRGP